MEIFTSLVDLRAARARLPAPLGLVPTMGFLHEGHLSLVHAARSDCASVVVSIFVNPTQFGPSEDLATYPRDLDRDLQMLSEEGVDLVWTPPVQEMYPDGFQTWITVDELTQPLEGAMRPGHFRGVTTVVAKLFNAVRPDSAYFGQKDAQQVQVIRQMVRDLDFGLQIVVCPIVREADGLALSSRNAYLDPDERLAARVLFRALSAAHDAFRAGERDASRLRQLMETTLDNEPLARVQYASCARADSLLEIKGMVSGRALLSLAVFIGKTRLIDNCLIGD